MCIGGQPQDNTHPHPHHLIQSWHNKQKSGRGNKWHPPTPAKPHQTTRMDSSVVKVGAEVWVPDEEHGWLAGTVTKCTDANTFDFTGLDGKSRTFKYTGKTNAPCVRNTTLSEDRLDDLVRLSYLNQPTVMNTIRTRYMEDVIYTYSGLVLVSVNPYRDLGLYTETLMDTYSSGTKALGDLAPHVFAVASSALHSLRATRRSQSIIVSGESGAGKTENARHIMRYFTKAAMSGAAKTAAHRDGIEEAVLATSPVLEAFGNAKTIRNDNSSRFGKYMQVLFDEYGGIVGAEIQTYLLEKTRVIYQAKNERNYHVFYCLCAGAQAGNEALSGMGIRSWRDYNYTKQGDCGTIPRFNDAEEFMVLQESMERSGITKTEQTDIWRALHAVLCIGNMEKPDENDATLQSVAKLLSVSPKDFAHYLKFKRLNVGKEVVEKELNDSQFINNRDALAKHIYELLFDWILAKMNVALSPPSSVSRDSLRFIGVLDIYGFERMERNSFEQFCINYANEKLQSEFCEKVFKVEQATYEREGISWSTIDFNDNQPCIDIIESKTGILGLLDDECRVPNGNDKNYCDKLLKLNNKYICPVRFKNDHFCVKHYAYDVEYASEGFMEKNRDQVNVDLLMVVAASKEAFMASLMSNSPHIKTPNRASTAASFKNSLNSLMEMIRSTDTHYVRCIKPNEQKKPATFDGPHVLQQLQACGILETIRISAAGYPGRWSFKEFATRYCTMLSDIPENHQECCRAVLARAKIPVDGFQFGKTKLFFRAGVVIKLEEARLEILKASAVVIQAYGRMSNAQKWVDQCYVAAAVLQLVGAYRLDRIKAKALFTAFAAERLQRHMKIQAALRHKDRLRKAAYTLAQYANFHVCQTGLVPRLKLTGASRTIAALCQGMRQIRKARQEVAKLKAPAGGRRGSIDLEKKIIDMDSKLGKMAAKAGSLADQLDEVSAEKGALKSALDDKEHSLSDLEREKQELEERLLALQERLQSMDPNYKSSPGSLTAGLSPKPRRPRPPLSEESKKTLAELIASPLLQTELEEVIRACMPPAMPQDPEEEPVPEDVVLLPGRVLQRWLLVSMTVDVPGRDPESCLAQTDAILRLIRKILTANRPIDNALCAFWLANLTEVVSGLHHFITSSPDQSGVMTVTSEAMLASFGNVAWAVPVITARERIVRFVEDILGLWLSDLYGKMGGALRTVILEHQGVTDVRAPSPAPAGLFSVFSSLSFGAPSGPTEDKPDLDMVLTKLQETVHSMLNSGLSPALTTKILEFLMQHVSLGCFNQIMLRKSYATWKRGIQIQYNLTRLEEFLTALEIPTADAFACFNKVMQLSVLLQTAKSLETPETIQESCPDLSLLQVRRILMAYQPDRYDDGPVNPEIMQAIDQQIESELQEGEVLLDDDAGVLLKAGEVHFDIAAPPKAPVPADQLPSTLPSNLYKFFMLTADSI